MDKKVVKAVDKKVKSKEALNRSNFIEGATKKSLDEEDEIKNNKTK